MDLIKIGKYIAGKRKGQGMTQKQLAEKLGMSDKSVSKWERGICLPDVSVYFELCQILGISINEFLAGEDIAQENIQQRSEENIVEIVTDNKHRQRRLKTLICVLTVISILAVSVIGIAAYRANRPQNYIAPVPKDSVEMQVADLLAGPDGVFVYRFKTTDAYTKLKLYISEYRAGELVSKEDLGLDFDRVDSPEDGEILIMPDFSNFVIKLVVSTGSSKLSTEIPILEGVEGREYFGRSAAEISGETDIAYNEEQPLAACIYDKSEMRVPDIYAFGRGEIDALSKNDFVYYFSVAFCKE